MVALRGNDMQDMELIEIEKTSNQPLLEEIAADAMDFEEIVDEKKLSKHYKKMLKALDKECDKRYKNINLFLKNRDKVYWRMKNNPYYNDREAIDTYVKSIESRFSDKKDLVENCLRSVRVLRRYQKINTTEVFGFCDILPSLKSKIFRKGLPDIRVMTQSYTI